MADQIASQEPISVVLLSQGEGSEESECVAAWTKVLGDLNRDYELILVREGDAPITADGHLAQTFPPGCTMGVFCGSTAPGDNLRVGISLARHPLLAYAPCDNQFQPPDLTKFLKEIEQVHPYQDRRVDVVVGHRVAGPVPGWFGLADLLRCWTMRILFGMEVPRRESWLGWSAWRRRWVARWLFGVAVEDPECGFALYRRELFRRVSIQSQSDLVHVELLAKANFLGALMADVPVRWTPPGLTRRLTPLGSPGKGEVYRLFTRPDFGPAHLDETAPAPAG